jgi:hypothetical protein
MTDERHTFRSAIRDMLYDSDDSVESDDNAKSMDTEKFNDNDEDLVGYVREFKGKVLRLLTRLKVHISIARPTRDTYFQKHQLSLIQSHQSEV